MCTSKILSSACFSIFLAMGTAFGQATTAPAEHYPFQDPNLPAEDRINDLLKRMTIEEKVNALTTNPRVPRLGVAGTQHVEGLHGLTQGGPAAWGRPKTIPTTTFPQSIGLSAMWDPALLEKVAAQEAYEARYIVQSPKYGQASLVIRAPNSDLGRDPRWGRTEECFGEDAFLTGINTVAYVKGLQGNDPKYWATSSLMKHFLANSNEDGRTRTSSDFDERLFREYYAKPFEMGVVEGGSRAFMASYNMYNGTPCTSHPVLRDVTINEWGNNGIICTDAGALGNLVRSQHSEPDLAHAAAAAVKAGINQFLDNPRQAVNEALNQKLLTEAEVDERLRGNYRVMIKLGLMDPPDANPYAAIGSEAHDPIEPWLKPEVKALVRQVTRESIVLLKNEGNLLPLNDSTLRSVAIIGPRSFEVLGDWYGGTPPYAISAIDGIRLRMQLQAEARAGRGRGQGQGQGQAQNQPGQGAAGQAGAPASRPALAIGQPAPASRLAINFAPSDDDGGITYHAAHSDVCVVFVGNHPVGAAGWAQRTLPSFGKEALDRSSISLEQEELIKKVRAANPKTVVVLMSSFPYAINWTQQNVPAILQMTHCSQETGTAIADVLFGDYNPAGRLVQTWPKSIDDVPPMMDYNIRNGRTYQYAKAEPLYPFGFGLSYTTFKYENLKTDADSLSSGGTIHASVDITNTGPRAGDEVVQLYVKHTGSKVLRPAKELKGFQRVPLNPGETKTVTIDVPASRLAYWSVGKHAWNLEADDVELQIGASSADIKLTKTIKINGEAADAEDLKTPTTKPFK